MVARRASSPTHKDTEGSSDPNTMAEMCAAMGELHRLNQVIEDNILNIQQHQQEVTPLPPLEETEVLDPQTLLENIWETLVSEGFKHPSLAKFHEHNDPYEHVVSINTHMTIIKAFDSLSTTFCLVLSEMQSYDGTWAYHELPLVVTSI